MIPRYSRKEMESIWSTDFRYSKWLEVEIAACEAQAKLGIIPETAVENIKKKAKFDSKRIEEIEEVVKHDVIAFLTNVAEYVGEDSRFIHQGMTSSDVLDTALALQLKQASILLIDGLEKLAEAIKEKAFKYKDTVMIGRSHGIHAEPVTFGLKMALWYEEIKRSIARLENAKKTVSCGKISGAVGTFANISPFVEEYVCKKLGLSFEPVSTQIIQRDRHAEFFTTLAVIASTIEKFAVEIRHLQRTEVLEAEEYFSSGQKGSSAMPHKRNPVLSENLTGLARLIRGYSISALENVALWHERDISHSSVERVIAPDATIALDFMIYRAAGLIKNLAVYPENMEKNLNKLKGLIFSQRILLKLTLAGVSREEAYRLVQKNAMKVWEENVEFKELLLGDQEIISHLPKEEIEEAFDINYHTKYVDYIFNRVFKKRKT